MNEHKFRCGDVARIEGADFDIEVAYADENGYASWCGWPNGVVEVKKLALVEACSDEEHRKAVARWLDGPRSNDGHDRRRETIERLYRPRAYWNRRVLACREQVRIARDQLDACVSASVAAFKGPADVEPLPVNAAQRSAKVGEGET